MDLRVRHATRGDLPAVDALFQRSYPRLLKADYPPSVLVTAIQRLARAQPALVTSGTYFVALGPKDEVLGAGGWTPWDAFGNADGTGHVRHFATDPDHLGRGVGRAVLTHTINDAAQRKVRHMSCMSTRTAEGFYAAMGFERVQDEESVIEMSGGIGFPVIAMTRRLR